MLACFVVTDAACGLPLGVSLVCPRHPSQSDLKAQGGVMLACFVVTDAACGLPLGVSLRYASWRASYSEASTVRLRATVVRLVLMSLR
jgi:hypothetical protein